MDASRGIPPGATDAELKLRALSGPDGNKWRLFVLCLSFLGWGLLCILTLGILSFWLVPYMHSTFGAFYRAVVAEKGPPPTRTAPSPSPTAC